MLKTRNVNKILYKNYLICRMSPKFIHDNKKHNNTITASYNNASNLCLCISIKYAL